MVSVRLLAGVWIGGKSSERRIGGSVLFLDRVCLENGQAVLN